MSRLLSLSIALGSLVIVTSCNKAEPPQPAVAQAGSSRNQAEPSAESLNRARAGLKQKHGASDDWYNAIRRDPVGESAVFSIEVQRAVEASKTPVVIELVLTDIAKNGGVMRLLGYDGRVGSWVSFELACPEPIANQLMAAVKADTESMGYHGVIVAASLDATTPGYHRTYAADLVTSDEGKNSAELVDQGLSPRLSVSGTCLEAVYVPQYFPEF